MKLIIPHPGHFLALKEICKEATREADEIYMAGTPEVLGSGRITLHAPLLDEMEKQIQYLHEKRLKMGVILNPSCMGGQHLTSQGYNMFRWYFGKLNDMEVDTVTVAEPYLVEMLAKEFPDIKVVLSVIAHVDSPEKARFFEELGVDAITLDTNINRHFDILESIKEAVSSELRLLVNEACLYKCPFRYSHFNLFSHMTGIGNKPNIFSDYYYEKCISFRVRFPELIIKSPWIRPEDLKAYEAIGIDYFKMSGRANTIRWIIDCMKAYSNRSHDGNLMDLLDCPSELRDMFYIPNRELDGAIKQWMGCKKFCHKCGFCKATAERVIRVYEFKDSQRKTLPLSEVRTKCATS
ncbi:MAG: U32 family peptidase [Candidatus Methanoperedens sp.]|nr:U32 family peptidase [Candidatus Methanoperedens sp.]